MNQTLLDRLGKAEQANEADVVRGQLAMLRTAYQKTLLLLDALKSGLATLDEVELQPDGGWKLVDPPEHAGPTINGLPIDLAVAQMEAAEAQHNGEMPPALAERMEPGLPES